MIRILVYVKPGSRKGPAVEEGPSGALTLFVREQAVDGRANLAVIKLLAQWYQAPQRHIKIVRGQGSRHKLVCIYAQGAQ